VIQVLITINVFKNDDKACIFEWYTFFCIFWLDILTLLNGLCFLLLFQRVATKNTNNALRKRDEVESMRDSKKLELWKRKDYGTASMKKIMAGEGSTHYSFISKGTQNNKQKKSVAASSSINDDREE
jgi:hypothetical protein